MKVLLLIISNESSDTYLRHKELWRTQFHSHPEVECYFIEFHPSKHLIIENDTFYVRGNETYTPGIRDKTLECFKYFIDRGTTFDFLLRTNLSSLWNFTPLIKWLKHIPTLGQYFGIIGTHNSIRFVSGAGIFLTPDVVQKLVENRHLCSNIIDDVDFGYALSCIGIVPTRDALRTDLTNMKALISNRFNPNVYHYRLKLNLNNRIAETDARERLLKTMGVI
jgi:hypothetical protein